MTRLTIPQISFADLEFLGQGVRLEPVLQETSGFIDEHPELVEKVRRDLERGLKNAKIGRDGLAADQVLRSLILMRIKNWDYRELRERIADGYTLRRFTHFYSNRVPKHDAFNRAFSRLTPATLEAINEIVVQCAISLGLESGNKLRVDTTVVETDILCAAVDKMSNAERIVTRSPTLWDPANWSLCGCFTPHYGTRLSEAISASVALKRPDRNFGGIIASKVSSFTNGSARV